MKEFFSVTFAKGDYPDESDFSLYTDQVVAEKIYEEACSEEMQERAREDMSRFYVALHRVELINGHFVKTMIDHFTFYYDED